MNLTFQMRNLLPLFVLAVALGVGGCNSQDARDLGHDAEQLGKTAGRAAGNAQLVARVGAALLQRKGVDMSGLHIEAVGSTVTIGGHVRDEEERKRVIDTAEGVRGVDKVEDKLRIAGKS